VWRLVTNAGRIKVQQKWEDDKDGERLGEAVNISRVDLFMRGILGFWVNAICREIMAYTIPLMLMGFEQPMDFVVYCVGVNFICTLDDMKDKTFQLSMTRVLKVDDKVVAQKPDSRGAKDNPWLAGTVVAIDVESMQCTVRFEKDEAALDGIKEDEVFYAPDRPNDFEEEESIPADLYSQPVHFKRHVHHDPMTPVSSQKLESIREA